MKAALRKRIKAALAALDAEAMRAKSARAATAVTSLDAFVRAPSVMLYLPIAGEVDTTAIARAAWAAGKTVLFPRVDWSAPAMEAVARDSLTDGFRTGRRGLREPDGGAPTPPGRIAFVIVPALAYDRTGARLGRGGGFYDRFLASLGPDALRCGLAFAEQIVDETPVEPHDQRVDLLVTDEQVLWFNKERQP